jgi:predicted phosphohydrolase
MDVFGAHWRDHALRVEAAWSDRVEPEDVVCLPGDLSWAMRLSEATAELRWLGSLPGRKILVKGNHDYWWGSVAKVRAALPKGVYALQNDAVSVGEAAFAGARGWVDPRLDFSGLARGAPLEADEPQVLRGIQGEHEDEKIYRRELQRLDSSLRAVDPAARLRVALLHFPPTSPKLEETPVTRLLEDHRVDVVVFGHLHAASGEVSGGPFGARGGVTYYLVSADFSGFAPVLVAQVG